MERELVVLLVGLILIAIAKSVLGSSLSWRKKVYLDSEDSMDVSDDNESQEPDDPEGMTWWNIQRSTELNSEDRNKAAELYLSDKSSKRTGFASEEKNPRSKSDGRLSRMDCRRRPESKREWLIGLAFVRLCKHFGPRVRDEIVSALQSEVVLGRRDEELEDVGDTRGYDFDGKTYAMAFEIQKPALARCFRSAHNYYCSDSSPGGTSFSCISRYPACLQQLAINPRPDFQILWLRNYPRVLKYFDRLRRDQRTFQRAKTIAQELLKYGLMDRWRRLKSFKWAKSTVDDWDGSSIRNWNRVSKEIVLKTGPKLFDVCGFQKMGMLGTSNFRSEDCLRRIVGDLLIHEAKLQEDGATLEPEFFGGNVFVLNIIYAVKNALEEDKARYFRTVGNQEAFLKTIIRSILEGGVLEDDLSKYPWAEEFLSQWQASMIKNLSLRLVTTYLMTKGGVFGKTCNPLSRNKAAISSCWRRITAEIIRVESELLKQGSSLQSMFANHPLLENCVGLIDQALRESDYRPAQRALTFKKNPKINGLKPGELMNLLDDSLDEYKKEEDTPKIQTVENSTKTPDNTSTETIILSQDERKKVAKKLAKLFDTSSLFATLKQVIEKFT